MASAPPPPMNPSVELSDITVSADISSAEATYHKELRRYFETDPHDAARLRCANGVSAETLSSPSCTTILFHGKLSEPCLSQRNLTTSSLPCVRQLFITSFPGSATHAWAIQLRKKGITTTHESHFLEADVHVSWLSRTDVWQLSPNFTARSALDPGSLLAYGGMRARSWPGRELRGRELFSRCLYRRVLLQTREPLAAIRSHMILAVTCRSYDLLADQHLARSNASALAVCGLPLVPRAVARPNQLNSTLLRKPLVAYLLHRWWMWMVSALAVADGHYAIEREGSNLSRVCEMGGLNAWDCSPTYRGPAAHGANQGSVSSHSSHEQVPSVTWPEACAANADAALRVRRLANQLGYQYDGEDRNLAADCYRYESEALDSTGSRRSTVAKTIRVGSV